MSELSQLQALLRLQRDHDTQPIDATRLSEITEAATADVTLYRKVSKMVVGMARSLQPKKKKDNAAADKATPITTASTSSASG